MDYEGRLETLERGHEHAIKNPVCMIQLLCNSPVFRLFLVLSLKLSLSLDCLVVFKA